MSRAHVADPIAGLADERLAPSDKGLPSRAAGLTVAEFLDTRPRLGEFWTPVLVLDASAMHANAEVIQGFATQHGLELMPHGKTTMAPELWRLQLDTGATGITLATPGQVRTARAFGITSIMLANTLVAPAGLHFIADELADAGFAFSCWADSEATVDAMERGLAGFSLARPIDVLVDLGAAGGRTGARGVDTALAVARRIAASPVLRLAGVAGYEGSLGHDRSPAALDVVRGYLTELVELAAAVRPLIDGAPVVSAGGSAYLDVVAEVFASATATSDDRDAAGDDGNATRWILRSGASLLHDHGFYRGISPLDAATGVERPLRPAMRGYARVASHPEPGLALLDGGKRDFPFDEGLPVPLTVAPELGTAGRPLVGASVTALNDQHAYLRSDAALPVAVGDVVSLGLSHPCTAFDKWRFIPVVEHAGSDLVVGLVRTFF
ncbi:alanine racemase [Agromyces ramosus]|uniref:D-serine deaminase-like pyridoxal phosphate-dependent protein n=1 Tax=Agromyces ramosus TaxID=33879 RepID=A0ABU0RBX8_9MICO|nr:alanine racemase [Agromyces ramosus]MDQ0895267.1 D-serine deaminase-like pyridoxal phosphate-dependent protein [Agromyces ramosus]